jgi:soluble lytic murein transglycosylase
VTLDEGVALMKHAVWIVPLIVLLTAVGISVTRLQVLDGASVIGQLQSSDNAAHLINSNVLAEETFLPSERVAVQRTFALIKENNWKQAFLSAGEVSKKWFHTLIQWMYLQNPAHPHSFYDYMHFLNENPNWANKDKMLKDAERKIEFYYMNKDQIMDFFSQYEPVTGHGRMRLGEAHVENGNIDEGINLIKDGFIKAQFSTNELKEVRARHAMALTERDDIARANYLAWNRDHTGLEQLLPYLPKNYRLLFSARLKLMTHTYGVDYAIRVVPAELMNDMGLIYNRALWRFEKKRYNGSAALMGEYALDRVPNEFHNAWMALNLKLSRHFISNKETDQALRFLHVSDYLSPALKVNVLWYLGWLNLNFLQKPNIAQRNFTEMFVYSKTPRDASRAAYWAAKSYERQGDYSQSFSWYRQSAEHPTSFYGQLSASQIVGKKVTIHDSSDFNQEEYIAFKQSDQAKAIVLLQSNNFNRLSRIFLYSLGTQHDDLSVRVFAGRLAQELSNYQLGIRIAKYNSLNNHIFIDLSYPRIDIPLLGRHPLYVGDSSILAIIRQESEFVKNARSSVGAQGLMQIMPATRKAIIEELGFSYNEGDYSSPVDMNLALGAYYISYLNEKFDSYLPLALAAYNAGPTRVKEWLTRYGDPRKGEVEMVDFMELIPFSETRNYVQRVMESMKVYQLMTN